jgi:tetratricopeptide (TPR) repeat protein
MIQASENLSFPRRRESIFEYSSFPQCLITQFAIRQTSSFDELRNWTPAFAGMTYLVVAILVFMSFFSSAAAQPFFDVRQGNDAYNHGDYGEAKKKYEKAMSGAEKFEEKKEAVFNTGNALYKEKQYDDAMKQYESIAKNESLDKSLRSNAYYNMGNTLFKKAKAGTPEQRPDALREALAQYKQSLALNPSDLETKQNYEFARAQLRELEQKQQQDKKKKNKENNPPSLYAKQLFEQARVLVKQRRYDAAQNLLREGMAKDNTIEPNYQDFIERLKDITGISK